MMFLGGGVKSQHIIFIQPSHITVHLSQKFYITCLHSILSSFPVFFDCLEKTPSSWTDKICWRCHHPTFSYLAGAFWPCRACFFLLLPSELSLVQSKWVKLNRAQLVVLLSNHHPEYFWLIFCYPSHILSILLHHPVQSYWGYSCITSAMLGIGGVKGSGYLCQ